MNSLRFIIHAFCVGFVLLELLGTLNINVHGAIIKVEGDEELKELVKTSSNTEKVLTKPKTTLELVHVLLRHGPRTPVNTYPNDPYINDTFEPYGWGQLTGEAKVELYHIGKQLRKRYASILGPYYKGDVLHAQATASPRTIMSLQTVLAGLYPPLNTAMEWNKLLNWQPIPIFTDPEEQDIRLRQTAHCERYDQAFKEVFQLPEVLALHADYADMLKELTQKTGMNITTAHDVSSIYITFLAELAYGLQLPTWTEEYFPDKMHKLAVMSYLYNVYTTEMRKIKGGFFMEHMFGQMKQKIDNTLTPKARKMYIYCAHDWTVTNILSALNVWEPEMPRFSALIAIELHKNHETNEYYVEIYFQNDPNQEPKKLTVPKCTSQCPLTKLLELTADIIPDQSYEELCRVKTRISTSTEKSIEVQRLTTEGIRR